VAAPRNNYGSMTVAHLVPDGNHVKKGDTEIRQMNSRLIQQQVRVKMLKDQIDALIITAPHDGIVMHTYLKRINQWSICKPDIPCNRL
jgi:hypothetical protein